MAKYDVFISYSRKDSTIVKLVADKLRKEGLSVWIDEDGIESGDLFKKVITTAIENSSCLLFFSSESSNNSTWTAKEIGIAIYEKIPVIPVILDNAKYNPEIKFDLVNLDFVDMKEEQFHDKSIARIVKSIRKLLQNSECKNSDLNTIDETEEVLASNSDRNKVNVSPYDFHETSVHCNQSYPESPTYRKKDATKLKTFLHQSFSYPNIHIALFVCLFVFGGIIGLVLYPFILIIYYEIRRRQGLLIPALYIKQRKSILITMEIIIAALICWGGYLIYDTYKSKSHFDTSISMGQITDENLVSNSDTNLSDKENDELKKDSKPQESYESSTVIKMVGILGNKEMSLYLLPSGRNQIALELDINGDKFSTAYKSFLNRRTLKVDLDNADGSYIGSLDGLLAIENAVLTYKGEAHSQGKSSLFKDGNFEFHGNANDVIIQMIETQTNYESLSTMNSINLIRMTGKLANKEMSLYLLPSGRNQIALELDINGDKFSTAYKSFLNRRTLKVDLDNADGTYIGSLDGLLAIENDVLTYKGKAHSQGKSSLFKDGNFEFHGNANDAIVKMLESQIE